MAQLNLIKLIWRKEVHFGPCEMAAMQWLRVAQENPMYQAAIHKNRFKRLLRGLVALCIAMLLAGPSMAAGQLSNYLQKVQPQQIFPGATRFGEVTGVPPIAPVFRGESLLGYAYLNSDVTSSVGYSGKPIHIVVGIDPKGVVRGLKLVDHKEPIVLIGIPEAKVVASVNALIGKDLGRVSAGSRGRRRSTSSAAPP